MLLALVVFCGCVAIKRCIFKHNVGTLVRHPQKTLPLIMRSKNATDIFPRRVVQTYKTRLLQPNMRKNVQIGIDLNPTYSFFLYDNAGCRAWLKENMPRSYVSAFDSLIPGAYKADLFRMAELSVNGGIYMDISMTPLIQFDDWLDEDLQRHGCTHAFVKDRHDAIYQAFFACPAGSAFVRFLADACVERVTKQERGDSCLDVIGPDFIGKSLKKFVGRSLSEKFSAGEVLTGADGSRILILPHHCNASGGYVQSAARRNVLKTKYDGWRDDRIKDANPHYCRLWNENKIYNTGEFEHEESPSQLETLQSSDDKEEGIDRVQRSLRRAAAITKQGAPVSSHGGVPCGRKHS